MPEPRIWNTHTYRFTDGQAVHYREFGEVGYLRLFEYRAPIVAVRLVEDAAGAYRGFIDAVDPTQIDFVMLAQIFEIQFAYGSRAESEAGHGQVVRLRVEEIDNDR